MRKTILSLLLLVSCVFAETTVHVSNFDFEQQLNGWRDAGPPETKTPSPKRHHTAPTAGNDIQPR